MNIVLEGLGAPFTYDPAIVPCIRLLLRFLSACSCFFGTCHVLLSLSVTVVAIGTVLGVRTTFSIVRCL